MRGLAGVFFTGMNVAAVDSPDGSLEFALEKTTRVPSQILLVNLASYSPSVTQM